MPAGTNATVAIAGDTIVTAASFPQTKDQRAMIIAYRLGATGSATTPGTTTGTTTETTTGTTTTGTTTGAAEANGESVFKSNCGSCHTLAAAGTGGSVGPNLDELQPDASTVEQKVRNGGGGMPSFEGRLSDAEIAAVAAYVSENAGKGGSGEGGGQGP
jgi:mono/diheme cytochrome c family protein